MNFLHSKTYNQDIDITMRHIVEINKLWNKNILVTGATGTIGSFIVDVLIRLNQEKNANIKLFVTSRNKENSKIHYSTNECVKVLYYDMRRPIEFDVAVDYVIHAAGNAHPVLFTEDPVGTIIGNIESTYNLLEYTKGHGGKRFLYVSSGEIYGQGDASLDDFIETYSGYVDIASSRSCYPLSKRMAENLCVSFGKQYGLENVIVRPCHTYGPYITATDSRAHAQFFRNGLAGEDIVMKSVGNQVRSYNYVADCVAALFTVLTCGTDGEAYNLANPHSRLSIAELARKIADAASCDVKYEKPTDYELKNQSPILKQVLNTEKIEKLGWHSAFSVEDGVQHTLDILSEYMNFQKKYT